MTFDEELFYEGDGENHAITREDAIKLVHILHKQDTEEPATPAVAKPLEPNQETEECPAKQELGGGALELEPLSVGPANVEESNVAPTTEAPSLANKAHGEHAGGASRFRLISPDATPELELRNARAGELEQSNQATSPQEVHSPANRALARSTIGQQAPSRSNN